MVKINTKIARSTFMTIGNSVAMNSGATIIQLIGMAIVLMSIAIGQQTKLARI
jgi:hypothetical protein